MYIQQCEICGLERRSQLPGREFLVPNAGLFAPGFFPAGHGDDFLEKPPAHLAKLPPAEAAALVKLGLAILNLNEFLFID